RPNIRPVDVGDEGDVAESSEHLSTQFRVRAHAQPVRHDEDARPRLLRRRIVSDVSVQLDAVVPVRDGGSLELRPIRNGDACEQLLVSGGQVGHRLLLRLAVTLPRGARWRLGGLGRGIRPTLKAWPRNTLTNRMPTATYSAWTARSPASSTTRCSATRCR